MTLKEPDGVNRRRRGAELEDALLDAAWSELSDKGYEAFTIESVAERAQTSRAVLYRRWPAKADLVRAALVRNALRNRVTVPDTGNLRDDLMAILRASNRIRIPFAIMITTRLGAFYAETGTSFGDLREELLGDRETAVDAVFDRAVARGEIDPARLTPRTRGLVFDLYRHEVLMTNRAVPKQVLESILDEVVLPLIGKV